MLKIIKYIKTFTLLFLIVFSLIGCTILQKEKGSIGHFPIDSPVTSGPSTTEGSIGSTDMSVDQPWSKEVPTSLDWQIELRGDPGIQLNNKPTHLSADKLNFIITFNQEMNPNSVIEAFQKNLETYPKDTDIHFTPSLDFKWHNPLQVEITFSGQDLPYDDMIFTLSPQGSENKHGDQQLVEDKKFSFKLSQDKELYYVDLTGKLSKSITKIPYSLVPLSQNQNGEQLLLFRTYDIDSEGPIIPYVFDLPSKKIKRIYPETEDRPFWGNDLKLYSLKDHALVRMNDEEEQWVEFGDFPYIHGWSTSPDLHYELYFLSKDLDPIKTKVSILVKDLQTQTEKIYENILPMNDLDPQTGGIVQFPIRWISDNKQIYIPTFEESSGRKLSDYLFTVDNGELVIAPEYLQIESFYGLGSPAWSKDNKYIAFNEYGKQTGIYDSEGNMQYKWQTYIPNGAFYWNPKKDIVAFQSVTDTGHFIVQYDVTSGVTTLTEGDYSILGWKADGTALHVYK